MSIKMLSQTVLVKNKNIGLKCQILKMTNTVADSGTYLA